MNTHFLSKTKRLAVKTVVSTSILIVLTGMITPLTAFACTQAEFATILKGFCQAFKADLQRDQSVTNSELKSITKGTKTVKDVLENSKHNLSDSDVLTFETDEIGIANSDFTAGTTYAPDACGLGTTRDTATDKKDFQTYFNRLYSDWWYTEEYPPGREKVDEIRRCKLQGAEVFGSDKSDSRRVYAACACF